VGLRLPRETAKSRRCFAPRNPRPDAEYAFQDFELIEARQPPLKDQYDEWLARIICYAFSVPVSPLVSRVNRATSETLPRLQMHHPAQAQTQAFPGTRTKREHFLDRLRRLPSRADIHDLERRLGERMDSLAARFDRALDPHHS
jgi:hypothetical protein